MNQGEVLMTGTPDEVRTIDGCRRSTPELVDQPRPDAASGGGECVLRFDNVNAFYGESHILNDATLDVRNDEIVALLGRNGAGKSTLLKAAVRACATGIGHD